MSHGECVWRVRHVAFDLIPIEAAVSRVNSFYVAGECRTGQRPGHAALPVRLPGDNLRRSIGAAQSINEIVPGGEVLAVESRLQVRMERAEAAIELQAACGRGEHARLECNIVRHHAVVIVEPRDYGDLSGARGRG